MDNPTNWHASQPQIAIARRRPTHTHTHTHTDSRNINIKMAARHVRLGRVGREREGGEGGGHSA